MRIRRVVDDEVHDDAQPELLGAVHELDEIAESPCPRMDAVVVRHVIPVVTVRRRIEGQQPDAGDAQAGQIGELVREPDEIPDAVSVRIDERLDVQAVDDGVLVPEVVDHRR
jgi:hypothetical protein